MGTTTVREYMSNDIRRSRNVALRTFQEYVTMDPLYDFFVRVTDIEANDYDIVLTVDASPADFGKVREDMTFFLSMNMPSWASDMFRVRVEACE